MSKWIRPAVFTALGVAAVLAMPSRASAQIRVGIVVGAPVPYYASPYPYLYTNAYASPYYYPYAYGDPYFSAYYRFGFSPFRYGVPRSRVIYGGVYRGGYGSGYRGGYRRRH